MLILTEENKLQIKEHALREFPNECCGLFIDKMGILELKNQSKTPAESFIIDYNTLKKAERYGKVEGFYHSHPEDDFSNIDNLISEKRMLSSVIYKIKEDSFSIYNPIGLEIPYVGREFVMGIFDCFTLVQEYYLRERNIKIPDFVHKYRYIEDISQIEEINIKENRDLINFFIKNGFHSVNNLQNSDLIIGRYKGVFAPSNCMIYLGNNKVLRQYFNSPSEIETYSKVLRRYTVEVLRHETLK